MTDVPETLPLYTAAELHETYAYSKKSHRAVSRVVPLDEYTRLAASMGRITTSDKLYLGNHGGLLVLGCEVVPGEDLER